MLVAKPLVPFRFRLPSFSQGMRSWLCGLSSSYNRGKRAPNYASKQKLKLIILHWKLASSAHYCPSITATKWPRSAVSINHSVKAQAGNCYNWRWWWTLFPRCGLSLATSPIPLPAVRACVRACMCVCVLCLFVVCVCLLPICALQGAAMLVRSLGHGRHPNAGHHYNDLLRSMCSY